VQRHFREVKIRVLHFPSMEVPRRGRSGRERRLLRSTRIVLGQAMMTCIEIKIDAGYLSALLSSNLWDCPNLSFDVGAVQRDFSGVNGPRHSSSTTKATKARTRLKIS
jgi:hypothetical protein